MWAIVKDNEITETFSNLKGLVVGNTRHSRKIFSLWTEAERNAIGVYEIVHDNSNRKDDTLYINTDVSYAFADGKVTASFGTATPKEIDDVTVDGITTAGLKTVKKSFIDTECANLLQDSDWRVTRQEETGSAMDSGWKTWRASVRTKCNSMQAQIDGAADVDALAALYEYTGDPRTRPLGEFPVKE